MLSFLFEYWLNLLRYIGADEELTHALRTTTMALLASSTPNCGSGDQLTHLQLDEACLTVENSDPKTQLQLWAQSEECYTCPPWKYLTLNASSAQDLVVNSTYPTQLYIRTENGTDVHSEYLLMRKSNYHPLRIILENMEDISLDLVQKAITSIKVLSLPHNEYLPLLIAAIFFAMLVFIWQCGKMLMRRMDSSTYPVESTTRTSEHSPLLSPRQESAAASSASYSLSPPTNTQPSTSSALSDASHIMSSTSIVVPDSRRTGGRLLSLDTFRGMAIVVMIFVNYGGGKYYFFKHARWNGLTVADLVFPWFLWIMGVSLVFSVRSQLRRATKRYVMVMRILKRCLILFALGIVVNSEGHNYLPTFRILGVLQRFAICYFITAVMEVYLMEPQESPQYVWYWPVRDLVRSWLQWFLTVVLVAVHIAITFSLKVPGCPTGYLGPGGLHEGGKYANCTGGAAGYIDRMVLGISHVYPRPTCQVVYNGDTPYDPEGLLGALTSVLIVQFGVAAGRIIATYQDHNPRIKRWIVWGIVTGLLAGCFCSWRKEGGLIPVNKNLWSLSYVLTTACFAFFLFSVFYVVIDKWQWWSGNPLRYAGMNSIVLYVGHEICGSLLPFSWQPVAQYHVYHLIMNLWGASLWVFIAYFLHLKKIYVSV
ncbi:heparan-alpha-glucosaminide N-acetyltransferase-like [Penaeus chinensis]|uniref:heparan-alpha-glucosaminide N-acetyltransferase-like n=1 Tax=Penaeus chinensis TaxID=139456 RepID=UPI001FB747C8|nr:heparan-alpha-glucosaminide N-acetyltransferase-like [Penaeus chinensis]